jgi:hypothetical protein
VVPLILHGCKVLTNALRFSSSGRVDVADESGTATVARVLKLDHQAIGIGEVRRAGLLVNEFCNSSQHNT